MKHIVIINIISQKIIRDADADHSNDLTLAEFVNYVQQHEKKLRLTFNKLDANKDGDWIN